MILRRLGNKKKIAKKIQAHFPPHKIYIEPFFGAGGMFFNKPKAKYNIVNDLDSDVFNLFMVVMNRKEELLEAFKMMPIHQDLLNYWKKNKETDEIKKAIRLLFLSNFTFMNTKSTLILDAKKKLKFSQELAATFALILDVGFDNRPFDAFLKNIPKEMLNYKSLIYCDPPYVGCDKKQTEVYQMGAHWEEEDSMRLFDALQDTGCKWCMSEFDHPFILEQAKQRGLNVIVIGERNNLKNRRTEIIVTNYENRQQKLF